MRKLQDWMTRKKLDDAKVAAKIGCSRVQISRVRRGVCNPSPALAKKLAALTKIRWHEFIADTPRKAARVKEEAAVQ